MPCLTAEYYPRARRAGELTCTWILFFFLPRHCRIRMFMTVVRSKSHGVQMHGDHMFWGTKIQGPPDSKVCEGYSSTNLTRTGAVDMPSSSGCFLAPGAYGV